MTDRIILTDITVGNLPTNSKIAVHLHLFYPDSVSEFVKYLSNIPHLFDLYISIPDTVECVETLIQQDFQAIPNVDSILIERTPNRGRDIAPIVCTFGRDLLKYDILLHIQTKKTPRLKEPDWWRTFVLEHLLADKEEVSKILALLSGEYGIVSAPDYILTNQDWGNGNLELAQSLVDKSSLSINLKQKYPSIIFPQSSMFWSRVDYLTPFLTLPLKYEDFPEEPIGRDGTLAHAFERLFFVWGVNSGRKSAHLYMNKIEYIQYERFVKLGRKNSKHLKLMQRFVSISCILLVVLLISMIVIVINVLF